MAVAKHAYPVKDLRAVFPEKKTAAQNYERNNGCRVPPVRQFPLRYRRLWYRN